MPTPVSTTARACASPIRDAARGRWRSFAVASGLVVIAHAGLLQSMPAALASMVQKDRAAHSQAAVFDTRIVSPVPVHAPVVLPAPAVEASPKSRVTRIAQGAAAVEIFDSNAVAKPAILAEQAIESIAPSTAPVTQITEAPGVLLASATPSRPEGPSKPANKSVEAQAIGALTIPAPLRIKYEVKGEVKGFPYFANGELLWEHDGVNYAARLEISHFILGSRTQTSKGSLTPQGLEPIRFGDKVRSEVAAHFERTKGKVSFSANAPDVPLQPGAQDQLSLFMQMGAMIGSDPGRFSPGTQMPFQAIGPRSSEQWVFKVAESEVLKLAGMDLHTIKLTRDANGEYDPRGEVWLAAELGYLPVRIRLIQPNGDFVEQNMRSAQKP